VAKELGSATGAYIAEDNTSILRVEETHHHAQSSQAEEWQRAQAWATWEKIEAGDRREVSKEQIDADFDDALRGMQPTIG
jgi:hypothetical protein